MPNNNDQFAETRDLVRALLRNNEVLSRNEERFRDAVSGLPNYKRAAAYEYVATLKERVRLCTESIEELHREAIESGEAIAEARRLLDNLRGEFTTNEKRGNDETTTLDATTREQSEGRSNA